jgi:hypothetical protein
MKYAHLIPLAVLVLSAVNSHAQARIYRCGNSYTNDAAEAKSKNCKLVEGGYITVVEGTRVQGAAGTAANNSTRVASSSPSSAGTRVDSADQKARDADSRQILEAELKKAEARQAELVKEYNNGEPDKQGAEARNYQKYLDRVADLKASIARNQSDIAGLRRELERAASK